MAKQSAKKKTASKAPAKKAKKVVKAKKKVVAKKAAKKQVKSKKVAPKKAAKKSVKAVKKASTKTKTVAKKSVAKKVPVKKIAAKKVKAVVKKPAAKKPAVKKNVPSLKAQLELQLAHKQRMSAETAALIDKGHAISDVTKPQHAMKEDKRATARHEHIHQFASRTPD